MTNSTPPTWHKPNGEPLACVEKIKVLNENLTELRQLAQDALDVTMIRVLSEQAWHDPIIHIQPNHDRLDIKNSTIGKVRQTDSRADGIYGCPTSLKSSDALLAAIKEELRS